MASITVDSGYDHSIAMFEFSESDADLSMDIRSLLCVFSFLCLEENELLE